MAPTIQRVLDVARHEINTTESGWGDKPGTQITPYGKWYAAVTGQKGYIDTYWCATFVSWVLATSGFAPPEAGRYGNCTPWVQWWKNRGRWGSTPRPGAIVFYSWNGDSKPEHVGIVESVRPDGKIVTIEGNTSPDPRLKDGVYRMVRRSAIIGYGYPPYAAAAPPTPAPKPSPGPAPDRPTPHRIRVTTKLNRFHLAGGGRPLIPPVQTAPYSTTTLDRLPYFAWPSIVLGLGGPDDPQHQGVVRAIQRLATQAYKTTTIPSGEIARGEIGPGTVAFLRMITTRAGSPWGPYPDVNGQRAGYALGAPTQW
jgi:surface antigen